MLQNGMLLLYHIVIIVFVEIVAALVRERSGVQSSAAAPVFTYYIFPKSSLVEYPHPLLENTYCKATWSKWHIRCKVSFGWSALFELLATMIDRKWLHPPHPILCYIAAQQALLYTQPS